jgi:hypothetical protein
MRRPCISLRRSTSETSKQSATGCHPNQRPAAPRVPQIRRVVGRQIGPRWQPADQRSIAADARRRTARAPLGAAHSCVEQRGRTASSRLRLRPAFICRPYRWDRSRSFPPRASKPGPRVDSSEIKARVDHTAGKVDDALRLPPGDCESGDRERNAASRTGRSVAVRQSLASLSYQGP